MTEAAYAVVSQLRWALSPWFTLTQSLSTWSLLTRRRARSVPWAIPLSSLDLSLIAHLTCRRELRSPILKGYKRCPYGKKSDTNITRRRIGSLFQTVLVHFCPEHNLQCLEVGREEGCSSSATLYVVHQQEGTRI